MYEHLKLAAMTPLKARAIELGAGALVGGVGAGFLGAKTHRTENPQFWLVGDQIYGRELSQDEKRSLVKRIGKSALLGAAGGAGLSSGISAIRRKLSSSADADRAKALYNSYFAQLNKEIRLQKASVRRTAGTPAHAEEAAALKWMQDYRGSRFGNPDEFVSRAKKRRDHLPWGGTYSRVHQQGDKMMKLPSESLAEGQMISEIGPRNIRFFQNEKGELRPKLQDTNYWLRRAVGAIRGQ